MSLLCAIWRISRRRMNASMPLARPSLADLTSPHRTPLQLSCRLAPRF